MRKEISTALLAVLGLLAALPAQAGMLGRFEVVTDRSRATDANERSSVLWSLDTTNGAISVCTPQQAVCKTEGGMWSKGEEGEQRYRVASHEIGGGSQMAELWVIDTITGMIKHCQSDLAAEPTLACGKQP